MVGAYRRWTMIHCPLLQIRVKHGAQVALAVRRQDHHDELAGVFRPLGHLHRRVDRCAGARSPPGAPPRAAMRRAISMASSLVTCTISSIMPVLSTAGTKPAPMPWILCGPGLPPDSTGESAGSTATILKRGSLRLEHLGHAGDAFRPCPRRPRRCPPCRPCRARFPRPSCAGGRRGWPGSRTAAGSSSADRRGHLSGAGDRALHALRAGREHQLRAVGSPATCAVPCSSTRASSACSGNPSRQRQRPAQCPCCRWSAPG